MPDRTTSESGDGRRRFALAYLLLTITMWLLALNPVIGRAVHGEVPPLGLAFWRWFVAAVVLLPFSWAGLRQDWSHYRAHLGTLCVLGCLVTGSTALVLIGLNFTSAINASLLNTTQPALVVMLSSVFLKERSTRVQVLGILAAIFGVLIVLTRFQWSAMATFRFNGGDILVLIAMCGLAAYAIMLRRIPNSLGATESLFIMLVAGSFALLPFYLVETAVYRPVPVTQTSIMAILTLALLVSCVATLFWNISTQIVGPSRASMFMNLIPIFGSLMAVLLLGEAFELFHIAGILLVCVGIVLVIRAR